ncbi:hypothetical protein [Stutzerimonas tarimensis]|uniref:DUF342 domain-containing protein n=1 Tax=Stutzerimonas tarimensis TaxID=1507735 RepID=A0ABV7T0L6_9GAMM
MTPHTLPPSQRGVATLLIVVLVGLSLTAAVGGGIYYNRAHQEQAITLHAQTQAQARAWAAAEIIREFWQEAAKSKENIESLVGAEAPIIFDQSIMPGTNASLVEMKNISADVYHAKVKIVATAASNTRAESNSTLEAIYQITPSGQSVNPEPDLRVIHFQDGLDISGDLKVHVSPGQTYEIVVDGDVRLGGLSTGGIDVIRSTGSIRFVGGSATNFQEMHANCDILLSNGNFTVNNVKATRNACLANTINSQSITANGSVEVTGGKHGDIRALSNKPAGTAQCATGAAQLCTISPTSGVKTNPTPTIDNIYSKGNVEINSSVNAGHIQAEGDLRIVGCAPNWSSAVYGGSFFDNPNCSRSATRSSQPVVLVPVPPVEVEAEVFDANTLRDLANYIYSYKNGAVRVKIQGVDGVRNSANEENPQEVRDNGYYYRRANIIDPTNTGWTNRTVDGYACINNNTPSRKDETDGHCLVQLGIANNITTPLPAYVNKWDFTGWEFNGKNHAPGVILADGDISIENGVYTNTFISTGNLRVTSAGGAVFSLNYAGPDGITAGGHTALGVCNNSIYSLRPTEFCKNGYTPKAHGGIGNYALLAGSCPPGSANGCSKSEYLGGDIKVDKSVFGAIKAGNLFTGSSSVSVHGYISALAQRSNGTTVNKITGGATIDLRVPAEAQDRYNPAGSSTTSDSGSGGPGDGSSGAAVNILWSRYI